MAKQIEIVIPKGYKKSDKSTDEKLVSEISTIELKNVYLDKTFISQGIIEIRDAQKILDIIIKRLEEKTENVEKKINKRKSVKKQINNKLKNN